MRRSWKGEEGEDSGKRKEGRGQNRGERVEEEVKGDDQFASLSSKWSCHFEKQELVFSTAVQYMESQLGGGQASCRLS